MMEGKMGKCEKCASETWSVVARLGTLETWRCESCGQEETVHVFDPANEPQLPVNLEPVCRIVGRWISRPSTQQMSEIQASFPALRNVPISTLLHKAIAQSDIELGRFTESEMRNLRPLLHRLGLTATETPIAMKPHEYHRMA
jgi:hypothetical protein